MTRKTLFALCLAITSFVALTGLACSPQAGTAPAATQATAAPDKAAATKIPATPKPDVTAKPAEAVKPSTPTAGTIQKPVDWPKKPITLVVPWDAGGASDIGMRLLASLMEKDLGTSIEVVDKPGAGSQVGLTEVALAKPDGYTIVNSSIPATITIALDGERKPAFALDGFSHIGLHVFDPGIIAVQPDSKYKTLKDLVEDAKANPGKIKAGTTGILGDDHLAILQLQKMTGAKFAIVHFTGGAPQQTALMGGHIDVAFNNVGDVATNHKNGKVRIIAVMDKERSKFIPEIPTSEEQGFKLYSASARSVSAPKGTPKEIVWALSRSMEQAMRDPEHIKKMEGQSLALKYMNPDDFTRYWMESAEQVKPLMPLAREN